MITVDAAERAAELYGEAVRNGNRHIVTATNQMLCAFVDQYPEDQRREVVAWLLDIVRNVTIDSAREGYTAAHAAREV